MIFNRKGFTLLELMVSLGILGILILLSVTTADLQIKNSIYFKVRALENRLLREINERMVSGISCNDALGGIEVPDKDDDKTNNPDSFTNPTSSSTYSNSLVANLQGEGWGVATDGREPWEPSDGLLTVKRIDIENLSLNTKSDGEDAEGMIRMVIEVEKRGVKETRKHTGVPIRAKVKFLEPFVDDDSDGESDSHRKNEIVKCAGELEVDQDLADLGCEGDRGEDEYANSSWWCIYRNRMPSSFYIGIDSQKTASYYTPVNLESDPVIEVTSENRDANSVILGYLARSGGSNSNTKNNTIVGDRAGESISGDLTNSVLIGALAGTASLSGSAQGVAIGSMSDIAAGDVPSISIGYNARPALSGSGCDEPSRRKNCSKEDGYGGIRIGSHAGHDSKEKRTVAIGYKASAKKPTAATSQGGQNVIIGAEANYHKSLTVTNNINSVVIGALGSGGSKENLGEQQDIDDDEGYYPKYHGAQKTDTYDFSSEKLYSQIAGDDFFNSHAPNVSGRGRVLLGTEAALCSGGSGITVGYAAGQSYKKSGGASTGEYPNIILGAFAGGGGARMKATATDLNSSELAEFADPNSYPLHTDHDSNLDDNSEDIIASSNICNEGAGGSNSSRNIFIGRGAAHKRFESLLVGGTYPKNSIVLGAQEKNTDDGDSYAGEDNVFIGHNSTRLHATGKIGKGNVILIPNIDASKLGAGDLGFGDIPSGNDKYYNKATIIGQLRAYKSGPEAQNPEPGEEKLSGDDESTLKYGDRYIWPYPHEGLLYIPSYIIGRKKSSSDETRYLAFLTEEDNDLSGSLHPIYNDKVYVTTRANTVPDAGSLSSGSSDYIIEATSPSDIRLKTKIKPIENALEKTLSLTGYYFSWKGNPKSHEVGLVAQEVKKVLPEVVEYHGITEKHFWVDYPKLLPLFTQAIHELHAKIEATYNQVMDLVEKVAKFMGFVDENIKSIEFQIKRNEMLIQQQKMLLGESSFGPKVSASLKPTPQSLNQAE